MVPIALAARDASGPAEMVLTRMPHLRPASNASGRVSLSSAPWADDMPPPYPGTVRSPARYVSEIADEPGRIIGPSRWSMLASEDADPPTAARYPLREVSSSGFFTSGPFASECTTTSRH